GEQQSVGKIDADKIGYRPVKREQTDRAEPDHVGKAPPADGPQGKILCPHEEQQQTEKRLNVNRHQEERMDVERHSSVSLPGPLRNQSPSLRIDACGKELMNVNRAKGRIRRYGFEVVAGGLTIGEKSAKILAGILPLHPRFRRLFGALVASWSLH